MSRSEFDEFVRRQQAEQREEKAFDPKRQLEEWLTFLGQLYNQIEGYLETYIKQKTAKTEYREVRLNEDFSGPYTARELLLKFGRSTVTFTPVGTMLVGSKGRVDVQGPAGSARLILINKQVTFARQLIQVTVRRADEPAPAPPAKQEVRQIEWAWKIVTPAPELKFIELTQDAFFDMILSVADA